jgi:hypothetical protein
MSRSPTISSSTVFLVNPASGNGATGRRWPELARRASALGLQGDTLLSERPGHLIELAREAVDSGATLVVAVGGDGTLNEVVNGVAGRGVELASIRSEPEWTSGARTTSRRSSRTRCASRSKATCGRSTPGMSPT